jgi:hypothetical protein
MKKPIESEKTETSVALPPPPRFEMVQQGSDVAVSKAIDKFTSEEPQAVKVLANLTQKDKHRLAVMDTIQKSFKFEFLKDYTLSYCTFSAAQDGKRSDQLTEVVKQPNIIAEGSSGLFGGLKERLVGRH